MASTRQGGGAWLLLCATAALAAMAHAQQGPSFPGFPNYSIGQCPQYQTSAEFTQEFIDQLTTVDTGYILALSDGAADSCQKLKFLDEDTFKYSYNDIANRPRIYSSTYTASPVNLTSPANIKLNLVIGMLGADILGRLTLIPLVADANKLVLASCSQLGAIKAEQLLVFLPYPSTANVSAIKEELIANKIPNAERVAEISQECAPVSIRNQQPLPLRFYNLISALNNPGRLTQNSVGNVRTPGIFARDRVNPGSLRSGLDVDETGNALPQPADNSVPFYTGNFDVPVFYDFQQPFVSTFASGFPAEVTYNAPQVQGVMTYNAPQVQGVTYNAPQVQGVTYTAAAHGVPESSIYQGNFPNQFYTQFYSQGK